MIGYLLPNYPLVAAFRAPPVRRARTAPRGLLASAPKISSYFHDADILASRGDLDRPISGLVMDSRRVLPGSLFFALPGRRTDGATFIDEAINRGAVAIVAERLPAATAARVTYLQVADARRTLARVAQRFFDFPDRSLDLVGITGTNGKTEVACLTQHLLTDPAQRVGLLGAVRYDLGSRRVPSYRATPESLELHGMLAQMRDAGCRQAVLELSSHGLHQQRTLGLHLGVAVFTNLTRDHLDYHGTMEEYFAVKARLFRGESAPAPRAAAINLDDAHGRRLAAELPAGLRVVTFGEAADALVRAEDVRLGPERTACRLVWPGGAVAVEMPLPGRSNLRNLLAAFAACVALGRDPAVIAPRLRTFPGVPGHMERLDVGQPARVVVDDAHTEDALRAALGHWRTHTPGRLFVVFGCGGHRDRAKRPRMTAVARELADFAWATADNPRGEPLARIFADMRAGVADETRLAFVEDRRRAIGLALAAARAGDTVLLAGKGHETRQEFADTIVPFDDRQVAREWLALRSTLPN